MPPADQHHRTGPQDLLRQELPTHTLGLDVKKAKIQVPRPQPFQKRPRIFYDEAQSDAGMKPVGLGKQVCCELDGDNGSQPDCHLTRVTTRGLVDVALDCSQVEKDLPATLDEKLSGLGQLDPGGGPLEEDDAEPVLDQPEVLAEPGLGEAEDLRRLANAAPVGDGHDLADVP